MKIIQKVWRKHGRYDVEKIWKLTQNIKTSRVSLAKLRHNLDKDLWTIIGDKKNRYITPNQVIANPFLSTEDYCKILRADLDYPIIIYDDHGDLDVLDGLHRLCKTYLLGYKTIKAKYVTPDLLKRAKII